VYLNFVTISKMNLKIYVVAVIESVVAKFVDKLTVPGEISEPTYYLKCAYKQRTQHENYEALKIDNHAPRDR